MFEKNFPADFISEAVDQTRGWFYTLTAISTLLFDRAPFENCIVLGNVNDKNGMKKGTDFPTDHKTQMMEAVKVVFRSWDNPRANVSIYCLFHHLRPLPKM